MVLRVDIHLVCVPGAEQRGPVCGAGHLGDGVELDARVVVQVQHRHLVLGPKGHKRHSGEERRGASAGDEGEGGLGTGGGEEERAVLAVICRVLCSAVHHGPVLVLFPVNLVLILGRHTIMRITQEVLLTHLASRRVVR